MTSPGKVVLPLVLGGLLWGLGGVADRAVAVEPADRAAGESPPLGGWKKQLLRWRDWLRENDPQRGDEDLDTEKQEIRNRIRNIRDPKALKPLEAMLADEQDYLRLLYLEAVAGIGGREALAVLVRVSVSAGDQEVHRAAAQWIGNMENAPEAIPQYVKYLAAHRYSPAAAEALSISGLTRQVSMIEDLDPALTNGLINALEVTETRRVGVGGWGGVRMWGSSSPSYSRWWTRRYVRVQEHVSNPQALKTLTKYTGEDYGYDQKAWKKWYRERRNMIRKEK